MEMRVPTVWIILILDTMLVFGQDHDFSSTRGRGGKRKKVSPRVEDTIADLLRFYSKNDPPMLDKPTEVKLGIYVNSFYSISEQTMDYSLSFYLRESWRDPRLEFHPLQVIRKGKPDALTTIKLNHDHWKQLWTPDVFFRNEKKAMFHTVTVNNLMLTLNITGHLWYVAKISATLSCPMKLHKYPLDTQTCPMMFESFGYTMDTMYFSWLDSPVDVDPAVQLPQFSLKDKVLYDCSQNYTAGAFPCLSVEFVLRREIGYFLIQIYIPSILIVILSWVSFWINIDAIPARVTFGLLTVLTTTTMSTGANASLPRVSYVKAIDVWMSMCLVFVFIALLEFAVVNVISRKGARTVNPVRRPPPPMQRLGPEGGLDQTKNQFSICCLKINIVENGTERTPPTPQRGDMEGKHKARKIDKISRKMFPLAFLLFNIVYWIAYGVPSQAGE